MRIYRFALAIFLTLFGIAPVMTTAIAATTGVLPGPEIPLTEPSGILDQIYGLSNLARVDDNWDQIWSSSTVTVTAKAKHAAYGQDFGMIPRNIDGTFNSSDFVHLFTVSGSTNGVHLMGFDAIFNPGNADFVWALNPSGAPMWTSRPAENRDELDHMVTWRIVDQAGKPDNTIGHYVIAWEDLKGGGDRDYNDLVAEVHITQVPLPGAVWILGSGLLGVAGIRSRFNISRIHPDRSISGTRTTG